MKSPSELTATPGISTESTRARVAPSSRSCTEEILQWSGGRLRVRRLGLVDYASTCGEMRRRTERWPSGAEGVEDEIWMLEHPPVFTLGVAGRREHLLVPGDIPVLQSDRGGQVTYHGPGQLVVYFLLDLRRYFPGVRALVAAVERLVIAVLADYGVSARCRPGAPGVYVGEAKIASLGMRIRRGRSYHGLSFNLDMDLEPFGRINPCGFQGLAVTQLTDLVPGIGFAEVADRLMAKIPDHLGRSQ